MDTALREAEEEIGPAAPPYHGNCRFSRPVSDQTGFLVTPVVAFVEPPFALTLDAFEVAEALKCRWPFCSTTTNHEYRSVLYEGQQRRYYAIPYQERFTPGRDSGHAGRLYRRLRGPLAG